MPNTSATGGYLVPTNVALDDNALKRFMHDVLVGLTGLDDELVRPAYQVNSPPIPDVTVDWLAFNIANRRTKDTPYTLQDDESQSLSTTELFDLLVSFYGPNSSGNAATLRDGLQVPQNLDQLIAAGITTTGQDGIVYIPELVNDRWFERSDININFNRNLSRTYEILSLLGAEGTMYFEDLATEDFNAGDTI